MERFIEKLPKHKKYVFIYDNGPCHKSKKALNFLYSLGENYKIEFLPPYSPQLNAIESCWKIIRHDVTNSTLFENVEMLKLEEIYATFKKMHDRGIDYAVSFIRGLEGDTQETFMQTADFVRNVLTPKFACAEVAKVYPNTFDAQRYEARTGRNVERAYCTGEDLVDNPSLGPENNGTLLLIPEQAALVSLGTVSNLFSQRARKDFGFDPIVPNAQYVEGRQGFFQRVN